MTTKLSYGCPAKCSFRKSLTAVGDSNTGALERREDLIDAGAGGRLLEDRPRAGNVWCRHRRAARDAEATPCYGRLDRFSGREERQERRDKIELATRHEDADDERRHGPVQRSKREDKEIAIREDQVGRRFHV